MAPLGEPKGFFKPNSLTCDGRIDETAQTKYQLVGDMNWKPRLAGRTKFSACCIQACSVVGVIVGSCTAIWRPSSMKPPTISHQLNSTTLRHHRFDLWPLLFQVYRQKLAFPRASFFPNQPTNQPTRLCPIIWPALHLQHVRGN